ncbi:cytochrome P450 [Cyathus striatus]|nr:cytochrome P450 [Cyathus striatus]
MEDLQYRLTFAIGITGALYLLRLYIRAWNSPLHDIPTIGHSGVLTSYITAVKYLFHGKDLVQEGYKKYHGQVFKIATLTDWLVLAAGSQMIEDIRKAKDEQLSPREAVKQALKTDLLLGPNALLDRYFAEVVRTHMTRNLPILFADAKNEIEAAFTDLIPANEDGWTEIAAYETVIKTVARISNRLFVGFPLCRDPDFMELLQKFPADLFKTARLLDFFPTFLQPIIARFINVERQIQRAMKHLVPLINERIAKIDALGSTYADQPNDILRWFLEHADRDHRTPRELTIRLLFLNFAAIHSTSTAFTHILFDLASHPECVSSMREEVEFVIADDGWTKEAMGKMRKLDSFVKETIRISSLGGHTMPRMVMNDFTLSNGQVIPSSTYLMVVSHAMHLDESIYPNGREFDGFRFTKMSDKEESETKHQLLTLSSEYVAFGHGRHACPGRFFAATELKAMLAHTLLNYDVMLHTDRRPDNVWYEDSQIPDPNIKVLFRKRK